jgi:hypothetical protein
LISKQRNEALTLELNPSDSEKVQWREHFLILKRIKFLVQLNNYRLLRNDIESMNVL